MPPFQPDKRRICPCGCGQSVPLFHDETGRFKGYARRIPGHRTPEHAAQIRAQHLIDLERAWAAQTQPIGSKRLHKTRSTVYYVIKVRPTGKWPYEHRHVME